MEKQKPLSTKKPPEPDESHRAIAAWISETRPALTPIVKKLDQLIRKQLARPRYAVKWGKAYYGAEAHGWCMEVVAYDVSVNVVFLNGSQLDPPPELGDETRYVKIRGMGDLESSELLSWIKQSCGMSGLGVVGTAGSNLSAR